MRLTLRLDFGPFSLGHGKIRLLELVDSEGSIAAAARAMDMSYRRAWLLIDAVNAMFDTPVTEGSPGGKGGGGMGLTPFGRDLVATYRALETEAANSAAERLTALARHVAASDPAKT